MLDKTVDVKLRNANVEAFRCSLMFIIVLYHCFIHGIFQDSLSWWTILFSSLLMWHVDGFVAISGWFGIKCSLRKFLHLLGPVLFYSFLSFIYVLVSGSEPIALKHFHVSAGWFGGTYLMLMMLAPMLNMMIDAMLKLGSKDLFKVWGLFALAMTLSWAPRNLFTGVNASGAGGFSIIMFVFVYLTVRLVRLLDMPIRRKHIVFAVAAFLSGIVGMGLVSIAVRLIKHTEINGLCFRAFCSYNAPYVWLMAVAMMVWFAKFVKVPEVLGKFLRFIGPSMFGIYLCHDTTSYGTLIYRLLEKWLVQNTVLHPSVIIVLCAVETFGFCLLIDLMRRGVFKLGEKMFVRFQN